MASQDFEREQKAFRAFLAAHLGRLEQARDIFVSLIQSILAQERIEVVQVLGRVKDGEESLRKFSRKYQEGLEAKNTPYEIRDYITDLIGLRVVCLYEKDVFSVRSVLENEFEVADITDKIAAVEGSEASFGYKGLHMDLKLCPPRADMREYKLFGDLSFEIQIRSIIQDAWSVLDHKIKYKKSIPLALKRRINTLAALFELADREFESIQQETEKLADWVGEAIADTDAPLDAFVFSRIVEPRFPDYQFQSRKVDGFVDEILQTAPLSAKEFARCVEEGFDLVMAYKAFISQDHKVKHAMNPYTVIRHLLYLYDKERYQGVLYDSQRERFGLWQQKQEDTAV